MLSPVADEPFTEVRGDRDTVHAGRVGNVADDLVGLRVDYDDVRRVADIQPMRRGVDRQIVPSAFAADRNLLGKMIRTILRLDAADCRERGDGRRCHYVSHNVLL